MALKPIAHNKLIGAAPESDADETFVPLYWSLLPGALAYSLLTQFWLAVYVVSLQRITKKPLVIQICRLNAVVRVAQKRPAKIIYIAMIPTGILECHADSGFSRNKTKAMVSVGST